MNQNSEEGQNIFDESLLHFKTLQYLFEKMPNENIREDIFEVCLETVRNDQNMALKEISLIQKYFNIEKNEFEEIGNNLIICSYSKTQTNVLFKSEH